MQEYVVIPLESAFLAQIQELVHIAKFSLHAPPSLKAKKDTTLLFVGDIMLSRKVGEKITAFHDPRFPFLKIRDLIHSADLAFGNFENPISSRGEKQGSIYSFRAHPSVVAGLTFAGFDVLSIANNHILDYGRDALEDTVTLLESNEIRAVGAGGDSGVANEPVIKVIGGTRIAFLAYTTLYTKSLEEREFSPGISHFEIESAKKNIQDLRTRADIIIVSFHWGEEYKTRSNTTQQKLAHTLIDAGADMIVGHHPHVAQEIERYKHGWILYSLGNFVFDQKFSEETMRGLMVRAVVREKRIAELEPIQIRLNDDFQPEAIPL